MTTQSYGHYELGEERNGPSVEDRQGSLTKDPQEPMAAVSSVMTDGSERSVDAMTSSVPDESDNESRTSGTGSSTHPRVTRLARGVGSRKS